MNVRTSKIVVIVNMILNLVIPIFFIWIGLCFPYLVNSIIQDISRNFIIGLMIFWIVIIVSSFIVYKLKKAELERHLKNIFLIIISVSFSLFVSTIISFLFYLSFPPVP